ncbi:MAG: amino acid ABC transporter permease [marine bacterium B5-7]|nr:MAG: amino acid ABC transporter permease [marine bacterium B5-7]
MKGFIATSSIEDRPPPAALARLWNRERVAGHLVMAFWIFLGVSLIWYLFVSWDPGLVAKYGPKMISGLVVTLGLVVTSLVFGSLLSLPIAMGRMSKNRLLSGLAYAYVYFFRGTPLLAQTFLVYYGLGSFSEELKSMGLWGFFREAWNCAVFAFTLNTAAYQAEILRGAIESVPRGQTEGAQALGLTKWRIFQKIIMPQALIVALRPYGNEIILMIKGSAIVAIITVYDLMGETRRAYSRTFDFQTYLWAAIMYLVMVEAIRLVWDRFEVRLTRHLKR